MSSKPRTLKHLKLRSLKQRALKLSWHSVPRRTCTLGDRQASKEYFRHQLGSFRRHVCDHYIGTFGSSHRVLEKGKYSRQFFSTSLRSLLALDSIPDQIKIPCWHLPHKCKYCHSHPHPPELWLSLFAHISAVPRRRGRPSRNEDTTAIELGTLLSFGSSENGLYSSSSSDSDCYLSDGSSGDESSSFSGQDYEVEILLDDSN